MIMSLGKFPCVSCSLSCLQLLCRMVDVGGLQTSASMDDSGVSEANGQFREAQL
jgi:hypothetical protein